VVEAQTAGVSNALNVPSVFLTAAEVWTRFAYAKKEMGLS